MRLDEHPDRGLVDEVLGCGLALRAVAAHTGAGRLEFGDRITTDHSIELGMSERAERWGAVGGDEQFGTDVRTVDHGCQGDGLLGVEEFGVALEDRVTRVCVGHQSSSSMKRWIVPPQVRPTAKASSSE